jgi:metal transporter CNNM
MQAALDLEHKMVKSVMTPIEKVYMLEINTKIDSTSMREIYKMGHSRIPVYEHNKDNIIGILMARDLLLINPDRVDVSLKQLSSILLRNTVNISADDKLEPLLGYFKKGLTHIGVVT